MKVLFITSSRLGDGVISLSVLNTLQKTLSPKARFTVVCGPSIVSLFSAFPHIEEIIAFEKKKYKRHWVSLWWKCLWKKWFLIVDLRGSPLSFFLSSQSKKIFYRNRENKPQAQAQLETLGFMKTAQPSVVYFPHHGQSAELFFKGEKYIALAPTAGSPQKCWPIENFILLGEKLKKRGFRLAVFYGAGTSEFLTMIPFLKAHPESLAFGGGHDLGFVAACLDKTCFFIGNDSGLMHLSAALGVPTLGLFGPSLAKRYAPQGRYAKVFEVPGKAGSGVMALLSVKRVEEHVLEIFRDLKIEKD